MGMKIDVPEGVFCFAALIQPKVTARSSRPWLLPGATFNDSIAAPEGRGGAFEKDRATKAVSCGGGTTLAIENRGDHASAQFCLGISALHGSQAPLRS